MLTAPAPDLAAVRALIGRVERADGPAERVRLLDGALSYWRGASLADTLVALCQDLEGLPLALEILDPRLRSHTVPELVAGLGRRLLSWRDARRRVSDRHRSVGSLMDDTFAVLADSQVSALESVSSLYGGAWLDEAAILCDSDPGRGEDLIVALLDRTVLVRTEWTSAPGCRCTRWCAPTPARG